MQMRLIPQEGRRTPPPPVVYALAQMLVKLWYYLCGVLQLPFFVSWYSKAQSFTFSDPSSQLGITSANRLAPIAIAVKVADMVKMKPRLRCALIDEAVTSGRTASLSKALNGGASGQGFWLKPLSKLGFELIWSLSFCFFSMRNQGRSLGDFEFLCLV